jgi:hypothetical protein
LIADRTGAVAQLGERRFCTPEVAGSIPVSSIYFLPGEQGADDSAVKDGLVVAHNSVGKANLVVADDSAVKDGLVVAHNSVGKANLVVADGDGPPDITIE